MLRVTADSDIYISAMNFGRAPGKSLDMARNGDIVLAISDPIVDCGGSDPCPTRQIRLD